MQNGQTDHHFDLWYLRAELRGWLSGMARKLVDGGASQAPACLVDLAKCLEWNAYRLDRVTHPSQDFPEPKLPTIAEIARDLKAAAMPLCEQPAAAKQSYRERMAALEIEIEALRAMLANRKGEPQ